MTERGARLDDHLAAMLAAWSGERAGYEGRFVAFSGVQARPLPYQRPHPPIIVGGHSPAAYRRAVETGNGWYGFNLTPDAAARSLAGLQVAADHHARPAALGDLEVTVTPRGEPDAVAADAFAAIGVHRLVLMPPRHLDRDDLLRYVERVGRQLIAVRPTG
jgi:alkanesulfonate monooxygenase SsuD/methylene tetrahydromethanopterin reductase-like flavin-dependent oxidoreductase (luciferase family)